MTIHKPTPSVPIPPPAKPHLVSRTVAVIGAGAAGLSTALELRKEGHTVVVYERATQIGGTWAYTPETEADTRNRGRPNGSRSDPESHPLQPLRLAADEPAPGGHGLPGLPVRGERQARERSEEVSGSRFGSEVSHVGLAEGRKWSVRSIIGNGEDGYDEVYDAVVVCNGHYTEPRVADIPGIDEWPGKQIHSHNYRVPDPFHNQVVVLIGSSASADDISRDIAKVAKEVHIASRSFQTLDTGKLSGHDKIWLHPMIERVHKDGTVTFQDGNAIYAEVILHCTGYKYHFPFLETNGIVTVEDNRVGPLYKHIIPPTFAPWLSFVGLPWKVVPFPLFEFQSK
ncbi:Flavin-containing monooxygenase FMO GS-OX-like 3 [Striga hermonthica]|uniref:Flavin-containing monooxygenase n=1 Tax=Striga hermonthica TaxID=68872 RepID=A0A9N7RSN8_STRHE|nr:Flavin-containing monooxygenase FMO GS-OX-like 3 [Striga hermonthica]